jgi:prevent-host-death family protein
MSQSIRFRNAQGELVDLQPVPATRFKNELAAMLEQAARGRPVAITRHDTPKAVLISYDEFRALMEARSPSLGALEAEFDALLDRMQGTTARAAMGRAFDASPESIGRAARKATAARIPKRSAARSRKRAAKRPG